MKPIIKIYEDPGQASIEVAHRIADIINENNANSKPTVLGLATGNTPILVYQELIKRYQQKQVSFKNVVTFNLDEYFPIPAHHTQSYVSFMKQNLFDHIDINWENVHIPNGALAYEDIAQHCQSYEAQITAAGGLDFQLLGVGRTGHIGFNEPGSAIDSKTRLVDLNSITRHDAINDFCGLENVPKQAISMGVDTIFKAKEIMLLAFHNKKADIIQKAINGVVTADIPASFLQNHPNITYVLDKASASKL